MATISAHKRRGFPFQLTLAFTIYPPMLPGRLEALLGQAISDGEVESDGVEVLAHQPQP